MKSVIIVLSALCLATIVAAIDTPAKPTPPTEYTLAAFAITPGGYVSARTYYDQANQRYTINIIISIILGSANKSNRARTDMFDKNFSQVGEFIGLFQAVRINVMILLSEANVGAPIIEQRILVRQHFRSMPRIRTQLSVGQHLGLLEQRRVYQQRRVLPRQTMRSLGHRVGYDRSAPEISDLRFLILVIRHKLRISRVFL
jgi:hypothetical protein